MTREEFFESIKLPYYAKIELGTSYYKVISEEEIIYVTDVIEHGIMVSPFYWKTISNHGVEITANEFEIKYIQALNKLKERI
jgi:hypothetical protein